VLISSIIQSASAQYAADPAEPSDPLKPSGIELRGFGPGILEFNKNLDDDFSCSDVTPKPETKIVERKKDSLLNIDEKPGYFFIILGQLNSASYQYLQIGLHRGNDSVGPVANPSYFIDLKKHEQSLMSGLYQGNPSLAVVLESDKEETSIHLEDNYKKYLGETSKDVTYPRNRLGPGEYDFHAILFQSDKPNWIQHDVCAISLYWDFSVNDEGVVTTNSPKTERGKISDVTKEFPPLQQHKKGVNIGNIECRHGLLLIMKSKDHTPACVKPESVTKLVAWGWAKNHVEQNMSDDNESEGGTRTSSYEVWTSQGQIIVEIDRMTNTVSSVKSLGNVDALLIEENQKKIIQAVLSNLKVEKLIEGNDYLIQQVRHTGVGCGTCVCPENGCAFVGFSTIASKHAGVTMGIILNPETGEVFDIKAGNEWEQKPIAISVEKSQQIIITNNDSTIGQTFNKALLTINGVTIHTGDIEYLSMKKGFITLIVDYNIKNIDDHSYSAHLLFEGVVEGDSYPYQHIGGGFDTALLPHEARNSYAAIQVVKDAREVTVVIKDPMTQNVIWEVPVDLGLYHSRITN